MNSLKSAVIFIPRESSADCICVLLTFQLQLVASDGGFPSRTSEIPVTLQVNVIRNNAAPRFTNEENVLATMNSDDRRGTRITQLIAIDDDEEVTLLC